LTVNEYETLLMRHDLSEVLRDPVRFMAEKAGHILGNPRAIPAKTLDYAKYDLVRVFNRLVDALGLRESLVESVLSRAIAMPASRFLRMKRSVSLLVCDRGTSGRGSIIEGTYQSPILVQWHRDARQSRVLEVTLTRFV
jgi:succinylglutamate desuccinylase